MNLGKQFSLKKRLDIGIKVGESTFGKYPSLHAEVVTLKINKHMACQTE